MTAGTPLVGRGQTVGLLGGSFDPPHEGHVRITEAAMARLYDRLFAAAGGHGRLLLAACADVERHEVGLRMLCDVLELDGWDTVFLGSSIPIGDLVAMVKERKPDVVALSASIAPHLARVRAAVDALREALGDRTPLIAVGGRAFHDDPGLAARIGADFTAIAPVAVGTPVPTTAALAPVDEGTGAASACS